MERGGKNENRRVDSPIPINPHPNLQPSENKLLGLYIDDMESFSVSVYFCKITTGGLNRNMRTGYRANDAGELTICVKFLLSCLNGHFSLGKFYILLV